MNNTEYFEMLRSDIPEMVNWLMVDSKLQELFTSRLKNWADITESERNETSFTNDTSYYLKKSMIRKILSTNPLDDIKLVKKNYQYLDNDYLSEPEYDENIYD